MKISEFLVEDEAKLIGPHEGQEVQLLLSGEKPLALLGPKEFAKCKPYIKSGKLVSAGRVNGYARSSMYLVTVPGQEWRGRQFKKAYDLLKLLPRRGVESKPYHIKLGLLLGYPKEAIRHFIQTRFR